MNHRILVAAEGEKSSWHTAKSKYAGLACSGKPQIGLEIIVFHGLPTMPPYRMTEQHNPQIALLAEQFTQQTHAAAVKMLSQIKQRIVEQGVKSEFVKTELAPERGRIAPQILQAATAYNCDTIAAGCRAKSMVSQFSSAASSNSGCATRRDLRFGRSNDAAT
jgi:nucleotide-binding universal stress UspA family protein